MRHWDNLLWFYLEDRELDHQYLCDALGEITLEPPVDVVWFKTPDQLSYALNKLILSAGGCLAGGKDDTLNVDIETADEKTQTVHFRKHDGVFEVNIECFIFDVKLANCESYSDVAKWAKQLHMLEGIDLLRPFYFLTDSLEGLFSSLDSLLAITVLLPNFSI